MRRSTRYSLTRCGGVTTPGDSLPVVSTRSDGTAPSFSSGREATRRLSSRAGPCSLAILRPSGINELGARRFTGPVRWGSDRGWQLPRPRYSLVLLVSGRHYLLRARAAPARDPQVGTNVSKVPKQLWVVNHYAAVPSKDGRSGRHLAFANHLRDHGWSTTLLVSSTTYPAGLQALHGRRLKQDTFEGEVRVRWLRANAYHGNTPLRFLGMLIFALVALLPRSTKDLPKPDAVIGSTVHPLAAWAGWRLARRYNVPFVYEVRDIWPDVLIELGRLRGKGPLAVAIRRLSKRLAIQASLVISPLAGVGKHLDAIGAGATPFLWVSNGIDSPERIEGEQRNRGGQLGTFTFMYIGSFNQSNRLADMISAFETLVAREPGRNWRLRLIGDGPLRGSLEACVASSASSALISVEPPIPKDEVIRTAREAECLVAMLHDYEVYRYGISLNKLYDYLLAARPVVFASNAPNDPISEAKAGLVVPPDDLDAFTRAMATIGNMTRKARNRMGENGRRHVVRSYSYEALTRKLVEGLDALVGDDRGRRE
ncbi:glycosyltransferase WbuB [Aeromicrobium phragmitis]|uniref:Glycosyltransferase WbuB n=1 Tax=Aeromicrobium phragmitis TaxID=2478914 RepID=A0A3L8PR40_9ACTN|nr:glycosyltransferase family 4 protein [Aeromicrobium phragmitis]RLV57093.1 glycosyltransferase WbuB [Aeromicrobium phragmitis]